MTKLLNLRTFYLVFAVLMSGALIGCEVDPQGKSPSQNDPSGSLDRKNGWKFIDGGGALPEINRTPGTSLAAHPKLVEVNSKIYLVWIERKNDNSVMQVHAAVLAGTEVKPEWKPIDGGTTTGLNRNPSLQVENPTAASFNGKLYVSWSERSSSNALQIRVA